MTPGHAFVPSGRFPPGCTIAAATGNATSDGSPMLMSTSDDPFAELYRVTITGPAGQLVVEVDTAAAVVAVAELPGQAGDNIVVAVATIGPLARSREAFASLTI